MNGFTKITARIAFFGVIAYFVLSAIVIALQEKLMVLISDINYYGFAIPWSYMIYPAICLVIFGLFLFLPKNDLKVSAILALYFYIMLSIFNSPLFFSALTTHSILTKGSASIASEAVISQFLSHVSFFTFRLACISFALSLGASIVPAFDGDSQENLAFRKRIPLILFSCFLGAFGVDRFYSKKIISGILKFAVNLLPNFVIFMVLNYYVGDGNFLDFLFPLFRALAMGSNSLLTIGFILSFIPGIVWNVADSVMAITGRSNFASEMNS